MIRACAGALAVVGLLAPAGVRAQSLTTGSLSGTVSAASIPLSGVSVLVQDPATRLARHVVTDGDGRFRVPFLPPCDCEVLVEQLGYRPRRITGVPVHAEERVALSVELIAAPPPVNVVDTVAFAALAAGGEPGELEGWIPGSALARLPSRQRTVWNAELLSSLADPSMDPGELSAGRQRLSVDGAPVPAARHPVLGGVLAGAAFPLGWIQGARVVAAEPDVESPGAPGPTLQVYTRTGADRAGLRAFGNWTGGALTSSQYFTGSAPSHSDLQGGALIAGHAMGDSASFAIGVEATRAGVLQPATWTAGDSLLARYAAVAQQTYGVSLDAFQRAGVVRQETLAGFGRFGWQFSAGSRFDLRVSGATLPAPPAGAAPAQLVVPSGTEASAEAQLASDLSPTWHQELRVAVDRSSRDFAQAGSSSAAPPAVTIFPVAAAPLWSGSNRPVSFTLTAVRASEALFLSMDRHLVKLGADFSAASHQQDYAPGMAGSFTFGGPDQFAQGTGLFRQVTGNVPNASFTVPSFGLFVQDAWEPIPALTLQFGARYEYTRLPQSSIAADLDWKRLTAIDNTALGRRFSYLSPRVAVTWDVQQRHEWLLLGSLGVYYGELDPSLLGELIGNDGQLSSREGLGSLGSWPAAPALSATPTGGHLLTVPGPELRAPRSTVATIGVRRDLGDGTVLEVSGMARRNEFLPRRRDLNLPVGPVAHDPHGRPIYGQLVQQGSMVAAQPGTNRRFSGYGAVWGLDDAGHGDELAATVSLQRPLGRSLRVLASYTYSRARDNWPTTGQAGAPTSVSADTLASFDWIQGPADLDVPHRAVLGLNLRVPGTYGPELSLLYRYRSGLPFTPGYGASADVDGDGVPGNEPAFLDPSLSGASSLFSQWSCLQSQAGQFAQRNSCRGPSLQTLNVRAELPLLRTDRFAAHVVVDGLNLLDAQGGIVDPAVYLVDATGSITGGSGGTVSVPFVANPDFGKVLTRLAPGRAVRLGLQITY